MLSSSQAAIDPSNIIPLLPISSSSKIETRKIQPSQPIRGRKRDSTQLNQPVASLAAQPVEVCGVLLLRAARGLGLSGESFSPG